MNEGGSDLMADWTEVELLLKAIDEVKENSESLSQQLKAEAKQIIEEHQDNRFINFRQF